jgi:hypothetical protein
MVTYPEYYLTSDLPFLELSLHDPLSPRFTGIETLTLQLQGLYPSKIFFIKVFIFFQIFRTELEISQTSHDKQTVINVNTSFIFLNSLLWG